MNTSQSTQSTSGNRQDGVSIASQGDGCENHATNSLNDSASAADSDGELKLSRLPKRKCPFVDDEASLSGSGSSDEEIDNLSDAGSIIDDRSDLESDISNITHSALLHSTMSMEEHNKLLKMTGADINDLGLSEIDDVELSSLKATGRDLDDIQQIQTAYLCGSELSKINRLYQTADRMVQGLVDPILDGLDSITVHSQSSGLFAFITEHLHIPVSDTQFIKLMDGVNLAMARLSTSSVRALTAFKTKICEYCFMDIIHGENVTIEDIDDALTSFKSILPKIGQETVDTLLKSITNITEPNIEKEKRKISMKEVIQETRSPIKSLDDFRLQMDSPSPERQAPPRKSRKLLSIAKPDPDVVVWVGDEPGVSDLLPIWKNTPSFKTVISRLRKESMSPEGGITLSDVCEIMKKYKDVVLAIHKESHCPVNLARKVAVDITNGYLRHESNIPLSQTNMFTQDSVSSLYINDTSSAAINLDGDEISRVPTNDEIGAIFHISHEDPRFILLPIGWKCRDGCAMGLFQDVPSMSANVKHIMMAIFGTADIVKFTESILDFQKFNAVANRMAKHGIFGVETKHRARLYGAAVTQILYVVLTMDRARQLREMANELIWFCKTKDIQLSHVLIEIFNNNDHFGECYKDVDDFRASSLDGGFIGPPDVKLRKQLKLQDLQSEEQSKAFQIIFERFQDAGIHTYPQAISLIITTVNDMNDGSDFRKALQMLMGSANQMSQTVKIAMWWNEQLEKFRPSFLNDNKGWLTFKIALQLFNDVRKLCAGHVLDDTVDIEDWDEDVYGPLLYRGTLLQRHIWNIIEDYRTKPTDLIRILKENGISLAHFYNVYYERLILGERRNKTVVFTGPKMSGKSITAAAIMNLHRGTRISLECHTGRDFIIDEASSHTGLVVIEDVQPKTLTFIDKNLRPHLDGDAIMTNKKMEKISKGHWGPTLITTNIPIDSDSDDESEPAQPFSFRRQDLLRHRQFPIVFRTHLPSVLGNGNVISHIDESDILNLIWRYGLFPQCNSLFENAPKCAYMPCSAALFSQHHPGCRLIADIASNLEFGVRMQTHKRRQATYECYDRVLNKYVGTLFNIDDKLGVHSALCWHFHCTTMEIANCRDEERKQKLIKVSAEISRFIDKVWIPLAYVSRYLRGDFSRKSACKWSHTNVIKHPLFDAWDGHQNIEPTMSAFLDTVEVEDRLNLLMLPWCSQRKLVLTFQNILLTKQGNLHSAWHQEVTCFKMRLINMLREYIKRSDRKKRWKHRGVQRYLSSRMLTDDISLVDSFDTLFLRIITPPSEMSIEVATTQKLRPTYFYD